MSHQGKQRARSGRKPDRRRPGAHQGRLADRLGEIGGAAGGLTRRHPDNRCQLDCRCIGHLGAPISPRCCANRTRIHPVSVGPFASPSPLRCAWSVAVGRSADAPSACFRSVRIEREHVCAPVVSDDIEVPLGVNGHAEIAVNGEDALGVIERSNEDVANG